MAERSPEAQQLFREIADVIEANPENYNQEAWHEGDGDVEFEDDGDWVLVEQCHTTGCIAGWACLLRANELEWKRYPYGVVKLANERYGDAAQQLLELSYEEMDILFSPNWVPKEDLSVPDALRKIAAGDEIRDVTGELEPEPDDECDDPDCSCHR